MSTETSSLRRWRVNKATLAILVATPCLLFIPSLAGVPPDLGVLAVLGLMAGRPRALIQAISSDVFLVLVGLAVAAWIASGHLDLANGAYVGEFVLGTLTGLALHFVYVQYAVAGSWPRLRTARLLAAYVTAISYGAVASGAGYHPLASLSLTFSSLTLFYLLAGRARLALLAILAPAFLLLNIKVILLALLAGCVVLDNLRPAVKGLQLHWRRAAVMVVVAVPLALSALWIWLPERFDDMLRPRSSHSTMARLDMANAGVSAFYDHPLLGLGGHGMNIDYNFLRYYHDTNLAPLIAAGKTRSHGKLYGGGFTSGVHNLFLDYLSTYGGISSVILIALLVRGFTLAVRHGLVLKIVAGLTILVLGLAWQYTTSAFGTALLVFVCWPFRFVAGSNAASRGHLDPVSGAPGSAA